MSKIEQLIKEKCPNGVKYVKLKDICNFKRGQSITIKNLKKGNYPVIAGGQVPSFYCDIYNRDYECITVSSSGAYAGCLNYWNNKILCTDSFSITSKNKNIVNNKFLFHCLEAMQECIYSMKKGAGIPHIHISDIDKLKIPVPPIEIQEEIVRILDKFSKLEAELEAELEARKKQYAFWVRQLIDKNEQLYSVGTLFDFKNGINKGKECFGSGNPIINYVDVYKNNKIIKEKVKGLVETNDSDLERYSCKKGDVFFTRTSETREEVGFASVLMNDMSSSVFSGFLLRARPITDLLIPEYCVYCFSSPRVRRDIISHANFTTRATVTGAILSKIKIYVPSKEEQERIVKILDKFDKLINDISEGIPAEIEARRKQYEYYRNKLLSFEELKVND